MTRDVRSEMINGVQKALDITPKAAQVLVQSLSYVKYAEVYRCIRANELDGIRTMFGVMMAEEPSINNIKPLANVTPNGAPVPPQPPAPGVQNDMDTPVNFKPGEKLRVGTQAGEIEADFNKMLPNGDIEVRVDNQIQRISAQDKNFTISKGVDENTSSGCIASSPTPMGTQKPPHVYRRKSK